jgi:hypothetical protein
MKQKLLKAQTELREAYVMARSNRVELRLSNEIKDGIVAVESAIFTLMQLNSEGYHAN